MKFHYFKPYINQKIISLVEPVYRPCMCVCTSHACEFNERQTKQHNYMDARVRAGERDQRRQN